MMRKSLTSVCILAMAWHIGSCRRGDAGGGEPPEVASAEEGQQVEEADDGSVTITEERAREIAQATAQEQGQDLSLYSITSVEEDAGSYWVHFEHAPPTPPSGHFSVRVDISSGEAELMQGE